MIPPKSIVYTLGITESIVVALDIHLASFIYKLQIKFTNTMAKK